MSTLVNLLYDQNLVGIGYEIYIYTHVYDFMISLCTLMILFIIHVDIIDYQYCLKNVVLKL